MSKIIKVKSLSKTFKVRTNNNILTGLFNPKNKSVNSVKKINFDINEGESVAFLGPNGAGKTTTIKMLTGLLYPTEGEVEVLGYTPFKRDPKYLRKIGLVMGNKSGLSWDLPASQSFEIIKQIYKIGSNDYSKRLKKLTELLEVSSLMDKQIRKLSLGERMKMELIGAILHQPKVLFLDEPTIGLDITSKKRIREFIKDLNKTEKITILLTSHDMDDIEKVCDRVLIINKGEKIYDDSLEKLMSQYKDEKFIRFIFETKPSRTELPYNELIREEKENSYLYEVPKEKMSDLVNQITQNYSLLDIDIQSVPLEEVIEGIFMR